MVTECTPAEEIRYWEQNLAMAQWEVARVADKALYLQAEAAQWVANVERKLADLRRQGA